MNAQTREMGVGLPIRVSAVLLWIHAIGFGLPGLLAIRNLLTGRELPVIFGFAAYGGGPFERFGIKTTVPLLTLFCWSASSRALGDGCRGAAGEAAPCWHWPCCPPADGSGGDSLCRCPHCSRSSAPC